jgi:hypothetical protein
MGDLLHTTPYVGKVLRINKATRCFHVTLSSTEVEDSWHHHTHFHQIKFYSIEPLKLLFQIQAAFVLVRMLRKAAIRNRIANGKSRILLSSD